MNLSKIYLEKVITLIINSLGLVAALAWDNAFQKLFRESTVLKNSGFDLMNEYKGILIFFP